MSEKKQDKKSITPACGIIMPISKFDEDHSEHHWAKVKAIICEAATDAGCDPSPVWERDGTDVIQAKILQNLYENDVIVCDISTINPNVMLEWGMRLTIKKPTIVIAEKGTRPPFDTSVIHVEFYDPKLQYDEVKGFIQKLSRTIRTNIESKKAGTYVPYLENFQFEKVQPSTVSISSEKKWERRLDDLEAKFRALAALQQSEPEMLWRASQTAATAAVEAASPPTRRWEHSNALARYRTVPEKFEPYATLPKEDASVLHPVFGPGTVVGSEGHLAVVRFDDTGLHLVDPRELQG